MMESATELRRRLLEWYRAAARPLPWRGVPGPYEVLVSEFMCQQTQVATVVPYYERWMKRFPTLAALAEASEDDVLHAWQGLGYYSRARSLLRIARTVVAECGGALPESADQLRRLPGIGPYTAGAISSIAFGRREPVVDGNVIRVLCRFYAWDGNPRSTELQRRIWSAASELVCPTAPGDFNSALMELGATVCTPTGARCGVCPLAGDCRALAEGVVDRLPRPAPRPLVTDVAMAAAVVRRDPGVLVIQLPLDAERWAGMWQFPTVEIESGESAEAAAARAAREWAGCVARIERPLMVVRHSVTRYRIRLEAFEAGWSGMTGAGVGSADVRWVLPATLGELALPAAHRRIARALLQAPTQPRLSLEEPPFDLRKRETE